MSHPYHPICGCRACGDLELAAERTDEAIEATAADLAKDPAALARASAELTDRVDPERVAAILAALADCYDMGYSRMVETVVPLARELAGHRDAALRDMAEAQMARQAADGPHPGPVLDATGLLSP
jgi:hypothetical protein